MKACAGQAGRGPPPAYSGEGIEMGDAPTVYIRGPSPYDDGDGNGWGRGGGDAAGGNPARLYFDELLPYLNIVHHTETLEDEGAGLGW